MFLKRIYSFLIDVILMALIGIVFKLVLVNTAIISNNIAGITLFIIFICRDILFVDGSIGKKIIKLKVECINKSLIRKIVRNITAFLWPIEGVVLLIFKRRIGDFIAGTNVILVDE